MDFEFIKQALPLYVEAANITVKIGFIGISLSVFLGILFALISFLKIPVLREFVAFYTEFSRNTPLLIQLFFLYFAFPRFGIKFSSEQCAVIGLTFLGTSYMAETFRSALLTVSQSQIESGLCVGLNRLQIVRYVIFPQSFSLAISGVCANIIFLLKETSVFSAVALADLMFVAKDLIGLYYKTEESLLLLVIAYFLILLPISILSRIVEKRISFYRR